MKNSIRKLRSYFILSHRLTRGEPSFSQEGEDRLLANIFREKKSGFYVDVGAHHPVYLSNTQLFYLKGWNGINIDANPECLREFNKYRKKDININSGVAGKKGTLTFYNFEEPALSSFDEKLSRERMNTGRKLKEEMPINVEPLNVLLEKFLPCGTDIDFLNIDVEGLDLEVLKSNDWKKFRPKIILVECLDLNVEKLSEHETCAFLKLHGYNFFGKLVNTCIFKEQNFERFDS